MKAWYILPVWLSAATGVLPAALTGPFGQLSQISALLGYSMGAGLVAAGVGWVHLSRAIDPRWAVVTAFVGGLLTSAVLVWARHS